MKMTWNVFGRVVMVLAMVAMRCWCLPLRNDQEARGLLLLDAITFPKIVPNADHDVVILVSDKSEFGDYATDSIRSDFYSFASHAQVEGESDSVIFAQLIVNGGENRKLAERIGVSATFRSPEMFIFPAGSAAAVKYPLDLPFHMSQLIAFTKRHSSLQFQMPGTLKGFDELAVKFLHADDERKGVLLEAAEKLAVTFEQPTEKETAAYYVKIMRRIQEHGPKYIKDEIGRQKRIIDDASKLTKSKKRNVEQRLNVLHHFMAHLGESTSAESPAPPREEL